MEQILSRLDEISEAQKTMTNKYGQALTQSASSNSGAGGSSHATTNEEESSMYMVSIKYYFHHSNIYNNILGQWDRHPSPSSKKPLPVWLAMIRPFFTKQEMATSLLLPSTKTERGALDQAKVTKIIGK